MTDHDALLAQLMSQEKILEKLSGQFDELRKEVSQVAVQRKEIDHLDSQINALWRKFDALNEPNGILTRMRDHQSSCPGDSLKASNRNLWGAIGLVITLIIGLKVFG